MNKNLRILTEGAICVALAVVLSYIKFDVGASGGSISFVMIPLIIFAVHSGGVAWGVAAGIVYGTLKYFLGGEAYTWQAIILDYSVAYGAVGLAGLTCGAKKMEKYAVGALIASVARYAVHVISGVVLWGEYAEIVYLGVSTPNPWLYSLVYNAFYMVFNAVIALALCPLIGKALERAVKPLKA